jgi:hypothetical protein
MQSLNDRRRLSKEADRAIAGGLGRGETLRIVVRGAFKTYLVATDRGILIWKKRRLTRYPWENLAEVAFGGGPLVNWLQVRGPGVGLVAPTLLNIGELPDAIQVAEVGDDRWKAALSLLVSQRAGGTPPDIRSESAHREASGAGGQLILGRDAVVIRHTGFRGFFRKALPDSTEIPLASIAAVDWREPGRFRLGRIGFRLHGEGEPRDAVNPENEVMFYLHQERPFREILFEVQRRLSRGTPGPKTSDNRQEDHPAR